MTARRPLPPVARSAAAAVVALAAAWFLASFLDASQHEWFFLDLAKLWLWNAAFSVACLSAGHAVVARLVPAAERSRLETLALSFPAGVTLWMLAMYVAGALHLFGHGLAVALPVLFTLAGARPGLRALREARDAGALTLSLSGIPLVVSVLGLLVVGLLVLGAMSPDAINYDASWVHMVVPQDYAREGRLVAFPGDQVKNVTHLGAMLTTWSFLVPGLDLPQLRWMMALHTEITVFLWTLVGIAAAARWLADRAEARGTWVALALFPGIFVYDSNLGGAADHFLALFAAPLLLVFAKLVRRFDRSIALLAGLLVGGALMTKVLQSIYLVVPLSLWAAARIGVLVLQGRKARAGDVDEAPPTLGDMARSAAAAAGVTLAVLSPYFLSNWIYYNNPTYPLLADVFKHTTPTYPDAPLLTKMVMADFHWHPPAALGERLTKAFEMMFTFPFLPHYSFVNNLPVFGQTFTLALPLLLLFTKKDGRRLWIGAFVGLLAVFSWAMSYWLDRNLQTLLPVLVATTAAILVRTWELGRLARVGVAALVAVQLAWATPLYFSGADRMTGAINLIRAGMEGRSREKLRSYRSEYVELGRSLPKDAVVLLHDQHVMLGIDRPVLLDWFGFQTLIDYRPYQTSRQVYDRFRELGVTHIVWTPGWRTCDSKQDEVLFDVFAHVYGATRRQFSELAVFPMPATPPPVEAPYRVLTLGMPIYPDGLYPVESLSQCEECPPFMQHHGPPIRTAPWAGALLDDAKVVLVGTGAPLDAPLSERLEREFETITAYSGFRVLLRRP